MIYIFTVYLKIYMINLTFTYLHGYTLIVGRTPIYMANISILT